MTVEIKWPWQYNFPPFFTIQPNLETRKKQLEAWKTLILNYFKQTNQYILDLSDISNLELFNNSSISRSLNRDDVILILDFLTRSENAEAIDKNKNRWYIYWHSLREWAHIIYSWAQKTNRTNSVLTFYEIRSTPNEEFTELNEEILSKALQLLESQEKAEIILLQDTCGVKIF
ncbi:hypothetical protein PGB90_003016 [Kerria lacca]